MKFLTRTISALSMVLMAALVLVLANVFIKVLDGALRGRNNFFAPAKQVKTSQIVPFKASVSTGDEKHNAIIRLHSEDGSFFCSASVVNDDYAITAGHCIVGNLGYMSKSTIYIQNSNMKDTGVTAIAVAVNNRLDYGVIKGDFKSFQKLKMQEKQIGFLGSTGPYIACGYPHGGPLTCTTFTVIHNQYFQMQGYGLLYPGMSGGPVIDVSKNELMAINSAVAEPGCLVSPIVYIWDDMGIKVQK